MAMRVLSPANYSRSPTAPPGGTTRPTRSAACSPGYSSRRGTGTRARYSPPPRHWPRDPDQAAGLIAVRLVSGAGPFLGWPEPYRIVVSTLRRHADVVVAAAALDVNTGTS